MFKKNFECEVTDIEVSEQMCCKVFQIQSLFSKDQVALFSKEQVAQIKVLADFFLKATAWLM